MSAKGRRKDEPVPYEYLPTPEWVVDRLVDRLRDRYGQAWLEGFDEHAEPCIGDGAICRAWSAAVGKPSTWIGNDIRDVSGLTDMGSARLGWLDQGDCVAWLDAYLTSDADGDRRRRLCITNPPFSLAVPALQAAVPRFDVTAFLLRVGILGAGTKDGRDDWFREHRANLFILPNRPDFDGGGGDSATYGWFVWGLPTLEAYDILDLTDDQVRKAAKHRAKARVKALRRELQERPPLTEQLALFG